jgi:hypothetical protein
MDELNVGTSKVYDAYNLGDARVDVVKDPIPPFITMNLDRDDLKHVPHMNGGAGIVLRRRVLGPAVFYTPWAYVDHLIVQRGASTGTSRMADLSEAYYVISGDGSVRWTTRRPLSRSATGSQSILARARASRPVLSRWN